MILLWRSQFSPRKLPQVIALQACTREVWFDSRPGYWLFWHRIFEVLFSTSRQSFELYTVLLTASLYKLQISIYSWFFKNSRITCRDYIINKLSTFSSHRPLSSSYIWHYINYAVDKMPLNKQKICTVTVIAKLFSNTGVFIKITNAPSRSNPPRRTQK